MKLKVKSHKEVSFEIFFKYPCDVSISIGNDGDKKGELKSKPVSGTQNFKVKTSKLTNVTYYQVQIKYKTENSSGSFTNGFTAKF